MRLVDYLDNAAAKHPDRAAIIDFEYGTGRQIELTFGELRRCVDQIAWSLIGLGVKRVRLIVPYNVALSAASALIFLLAHSLAPIYAALT